jgi:hypothetical protein
MVGMTLDEAERVLIAATLEHTEWNVRMATAILGIDRSTLYAKISRYRIAKYSTLSNSPAPKKKHYISPEGRARMAEAVRKRWAALKTAK